MNALRTSISEFLDAIMEGDAFCRDGRNSQGNTDFHIAQNMLHESSQPATQSTFQWVLVIRENESAWGLIHQESKISAASVYLKPDCGHHNWFVWDEHGTGGENSHAGTIKDAKTDAVEAVIRWGRHKFFHQLPDLLFAGKLLINSTSAGNIICKTFKGCEARHALLLAIQEHDPEFQKAPVYSDTDEGSRNLY